MSRSCDIRSSISLPLSLSIPLFSGVRRHRERADALILADEDTRHCNKIAHSNKSKGSQSGSGLSVYVSIDLF